MFKDEEARAATMIARYAAGNHDAAQARVMYRQMQTRIRNQVLSYVAGRTPIQVFIDNVAHNIRF